MNQKKFGWRIIGMGMGLGSTTIRLGQRLHERPGVIFYAFRFAHRLPGAWCAILEIDQVFMAIAAIARRQCPHTDTRSVILPSSATPMSCVRSGTMSASLLSPSGVRSRASAPATLPSGSQTISSPGRERSARYMEELTPQGGPGSERDLPLGNWRMMRRPVGERTAERRAAQEGLRDIGRAQEN